MSATIYILNGSKWETNEVNKMDIQKQINHPQTGFTTTDQGFNLMLQCTRCGK